MCCMGRGRLPSLLPPPPRFLQPPPNTHPHSLTSVTMPELQERNISGTALFSSIPARFCGKGGGIEQNAVRNSRCPLEACGLLSCPGKLKHDLTREDSPLLPGSALTRSFPPPQAHHQLLTRQSPACRSQRHAGHGGLRLLLFIDLEAVADACSTAALLSGPSPCLGAAVLPAQSHTHATRSQRMPHCCPWTHQQL